MTPISSASIVAQTTDGDGDVAATPGTASWVNGPKGSEGSMTRVRLLIVWRRECDGRWRIARDLLNADVGLGTMTDHGSGGGDSGIDGE